MEVSGAEAPHPMQVATSTARYLEHLHAVSLQGGHPNQDAGGALGLQLQ